MGKFKAALFDLDGTLFDTEDQYTVIWNRICTRFRPDIPGLEYKIKGMTLVQIFDQFFPDDKTREEIKIMLDEYEAEMRYEFVAGAREFIEDIKAHGVKCAVVTSSNQIKMASVARKMPEFNAIFDRILTAEDFSASKPEPDCYLQGASVFGCSLDECIVFEDAFNGLEAGRRSGIYTIGLAITNKREAIEDKCNFVLDDFVGFTFEKAQRLIG